ncbi:MAG: LysR family transcriptional regulator [Salaquimonas sp.]
MIIDFPNIRHLRAFREVVHTQSISEAAKRVHLSQPAVTQAINKLEDILEIKLFTRRSNGLFPSVACDILFPRIERLFEYLASGGQHASRIASRNQQQGFSNFQDLVTAAHLKALIAISETGNFSLAARSVDLSQPTIHRAARDLEKLAGFDLFTTTSKGVDLTPAAEAFVLQVKLAAAELRQGMAEIGNHRGAESTKIYVGSMPLSRTNILPTAIHELLQEAKNVQILAIDGPYSDLLKQLRHADLDFLIGALRDPIPSEDIVQEHLFDDPLSIIVGAHHPLTRKRNPKIEDTLAFPWIAPPKGTPAGGYLAEVLRIPSLPQTPVRTVSSSLVLMRGLLELGDYVTLMSRHQVSREIEQGLAVPLDIDLPGGHRPIGLTYRKDWRATGTQERFMDILRKTSLVAASKSSVR